MFRLTLQTVPIRYRIIANRMENSSGLKVRGVFCCLDVLQRKCYHNVCYQQIVFGEERRCIMARKESITREYLFQTAFQMVRDEGLENVTARKLAAKAGCSTQPIFRLYSNMEELWKELFEKGVEFFEEFYNRTPRYDSTPFVNLGVTYIRFAMEENNLFCMLFLTKNRYGKSLYEILNGKMAAVGRELIRAKSDGCTNPSQIFTQMWIFIHGAACMATTGDYDLQMEDTINMLKKAYKGFQG